MPGSAQGVELLFEGTEESPCETIPGNEGGVSALDSGNCASEGDYCI